MLDLAATLCASSAPRARPSSVMRASSPAVTSCPSNRRSCRPCYRLWAALDAASKCPTAACCSGVPLDGAPSPRHTDAATADVGLQAGETGALVGAVAGVLLAVRAARVAVVTGHLAGLPDWLVHGVEVRALDAQQAGADSTSGEQALVDPAPDRGGIHLHVGGCFSRAEVFGFCAHKR